MQLQIPVIVAFIFGLVLLYFLARILFLPLRIIATLLYNALLGGVLLWVTNLLGHYVALNIPINPITALVAGFLGVPGVILLIALQIFMIK
ncbi:MAG: pro-sigmaK processing inhibitor BofA family protein [Syntrophothermus sp.]